MYIERSVRCSVFGYKASGKCTLPNMFAEHDVLTVHLMRPFMFYPYI